MKKIILSLVVIVTIGFTSCKTEKKDTVNEEDVATAEYQCPMKCENDKTYTDKNTKCPVCKMELVEVKKDEENHNH